jgi:hypothetical protein
MMTEQIHFSASAQLYENTSGDLAIRFANNTVFENVAATPGHGFVSDALALINQGESSAGWRLVPFRTLQHDGKNWHLVSSFGFLDDDQSRPVLVLEVKPETLGRQAKEYLRTDLPVTLQEETGRSAGDHDASRPTMRDQITEASLELDSKSPYLCISCGHPDGIKTRRGQQFRYPLNDHFKDRFSEAVEELSDKSSFVCETCGRNQVVTSSTTH